jgi:hypothetical protein
VAVLREILPPPDVAPVFWVRLQEDISARLGSNHNVRALLVLRRLVEAGLVEAVLQYPHDVPKYRRRAPNTPTASA